MVGNPRRSSPRQAFTLVELLDAISVIAVLAVLLLPVLSRGKQKAEGAYGLNNGRHLMIEFPNSHAAEMKGD
jgi:prepilin-type N-terminal cleavage/methylation domain-containing protein